MSGGEAGRGGRGGSGMAKDEEIVEKRVNVEKRDEIHQRKEGA